jgi:hypothetical protein
MRNSKNPQTGDAPAQFGRVGAASWEAGRAFW